MKKTKLFGWAFVATMMSTGFTACSNDAEEVLAQESEIKLTSEITPSRVTSLDYQSTQIVAGQQVGVTVTGAKSEHNNVAWSVSEDGTLANTGDAIYFGDGSATITAYHPYNLAWSGTDKTEAFSVALDQSTNFGYLSSDLLWATASSSKTEDAVALKFAHKLAKINITLTSTDIQDLSNATISICGTHIGALFNPITGDLTLNSNSMNQIIKAAVTTGSSYTASAIIIPQTVVSGTKFIKVEHNSKIYYYTLTSDAEFEEGNSYGYNLVVTPSTELTLSSSSSGNIETWTPNTNLEEGEAGEVKLKSVTLLNAGTLSDHISTDEKLQIENLKITGDLNGADINLIREMAGNSGKLTFLDLSDANIVASDVTYSTSDGGYDYAYATEANTIGTLMFGLLNLENIVLPTSITAINDQAFGECKLTSLEIPDGVTTIGSGAFYACNNMTSVFIPSTVTSISNEAFVVNNNLYITVADANTAYTSVDGTLYSKDKTTLIAYTLGAVNKTFVIPNTVTTISGSTFTGTNLISLTIPNSVKNIKSLPYGNALKEIHCQIVDPTETTVSDCHSFSDATLYVPNESLEAYKNHSFWKQYTNIKGE